ncbi:type II toxin-antitoxin system PemK/MazF family toxin [Mycoplasmatota bacterium]|nr:type II toxin-antitoxin system PemK/MazF family toxin [Mycoplasmatota bacterium]
MYTKQFNANKSIINIVDKSNTQNEVKRSILYLEWIAKHSQLYHDEKKPLSIPDKIFPNKVTEFAYNRNSPSIQIKIDKYYNLIDGDYKRNSKSIDISDSLDLLHNLVFLRGNVIWAEFGFNVGCEFGGKHPAIILKNLGEVLIVAPLTSGSLTNPRPSEITIDMVFNLPRRDRYVNVTRITPISIYRVDLNSPMGGVRSSKMREVFRAIINEWN